MIITHSKKLFAKYLLTSILILTMAFIFAGCNSSYPIEIENNLASISLAFEKSENGSDFYTTIKPFMDPEKPEFAIEFARKLKDIKQMGVKTIEFKVIGLKKNFKIEGSNVTRVKIKEIYEKDNKVSSINYWADFTLKNDKAYFSDLAFEKLTTGNITLYYDEKLEPISKEIFQSIKTAYGKVSGVIPGRTEKIVVKAYSDSKIFASFVKPSIGFDMLGWNEAGEAVKINFGLVKWNNMETETLKKMLDTVLTHEITHLISGKMSGNNIPYWFAEGLATYVENSPADGLPSLSLDNLAAQNIENITDEKLLRQYYIDSEIYIKNFIRKKGMGELIRILKLMGEYPVNIVDAGSSMELTNKVFAEIIKKEYNLDTRKFGEMLLK